MTTEIDTLSAIQLSSPGGGKRHNDGKDGYVCWRNLPVTSHMLLSDDTSGPRPDPLTRLVAM